ncbi:MAG: lipopolysaccharide biosynthesis protein [Vicinamibacterales bacterium]
MTRTQKFLGGLGYGYATLVATTLAGLWLTPFVLDRLGQHDYGLWLVAAQITGYLGLLDLGVAALLPRETAYLTAADGTNGRGARGDLPALLGRTAAIVLAQAPLVLAAAAGAVLLLPQEWQAARGPLAVVLAVFVAAFPLRIFPAVLQGLQDLKFLGQVQIAAWSASTVLLVALIVAGARLYALAASTAVVLLAPVAASWLRVRRRHRQILPSRIAIGDMTAARKQVTASLWVSLTQIAQLLLNGTDLMIVAMVFGPAAAVPYSCTGKLVTVLMNQPQLLTSVAGPALSEIKASGDRDRLFRVSATLALATMLASGAIVAVILAINEGFVGWWVGPEQYGGTLLTLLFLLNMVSRHVNVAVSYALFCFGYERRVSIVALLDGAVTIALAIALVNGAGTAAVLVALVTSVWLVALPLNLRALQRELGGRLIEMAGVLGPWAWRFVLVVAAVGASLTGTVPARFLPLAAASSLVLLAYAAVMWPILFRGPLGLYTRPVLLALVDRHPALRRWAGRSGVLGLERQ